MNLAITFHHYIYRYSSLFIYIITLELDWLKRSVIPVVKMEENLGTTLASHGVKLLETSTIIEQEVDQEDEPKDLVPYEVIRAKNIKEKEEMFKQLFPDVNKGDIFKEVCKNQGVPEPGFGIKKVRPVVKRAKRTTVPEDRDEPVRRSERKRRSVNYNYDGEDNDMDFKVATGGKKRRVVSNEVKQAQGDDSDVNTRVLRPKRAQHYEELTDYEPQNDDFVFCEVCQKIEFHGCEKHPPNFSEPALCNLEISPSCVATNSGEGVFNRGVTIPVGTLFGPYTGKFIPQEVYKDVITAKIESGNAWEIRNSAMTKVIGVCDPGTEADGSSHWMAKINCPVREDDQNLVSFQLHGHIYYKVIKPIDTNADISTSG